MEWDKVALGVFPIMVGFDGLCGAAFLGPIFDLFAIHVCSSAGDITKENTINTDYNAHLHGIIHYAVQRNKATSPNGDLVTVVNAVITVWQCKRGRLPLLTTCRIFYHSILFFYLKSPGRKTTFRIGLITFINV